MSTAKNSEELEKQYREYRAQFEAWKEKNKNSVGTEAYIAYVNQFQDWERDVEKRRAKIRETVEREAADRERQRQEEEERANREREEKEKKEREAAEQAAAEAAAYAQHQQIYMAHHQAEMQKEQELKAQQALQQAQMQQQFSQPPPNMVQQQHTQSSVDEINAHTVMQEMVSIVMGAGAAVIGADKPTVYQQAPPTQTAATGPPPTLWGNSKMIYDPKDPLWARWGPRAAPCHMPPPPLPPSVPVPCWFVMDQMKEKQMMMAPSAAAPPPPFVSS